jgi:glutathione S-transferase
MHLYTFFKAPNPKRLGYFLKLKGIEIAATEVDINKGEHFNDAFKVINPDSTLPTLVLDDGTVLTDTIAICVYLESQHPEKPLFGINATEYAQVIGWAHKLYIDGFMAIAEILRNQGDFFKNRALPGRVDIEQIPDLIKRGNIRLDAFWLNMNKHLSDKDYIVGKQLTMADIDCYVVCGFATWVKAQIPESCTALLQWQKRVSAQLEK